MAFMVAEMTSLQDWYELYTDAGIWFVPVWVVDTDNLLDYTEGSKLYSSEIISGYGVRSSAPGYLDCTEWSVYEGLAEALAAYEDEKELCAYFLEEDY